MIRQFEEQEICDQIMYWEYFGIFVHAYAIRHTDRIEYAIEYPLPSTNGVTWILTDALTPAGICAECTQPTINDYLCKKCRVSI